MMVDRNGAPLKRGAPVMLMETPQDLLDDLPEEDQTAIMWAAKDGAMRFVGTDDYGNVELEFKDPSGTKHWITVPPTTVAMVA